MNYKNICKKLIYALKAYREKEKKIKAKRDYYAEKYRKNNPHKIIARSIARRRIKKRPCEICGSEKAQAHHVDYSKPLDVIFMCSSCHNKKHTTIEEKSYKIYQDTKTKFNIKSRAIVCLNDGIVYKKIKDAAIKYNLHKTNIIKVCKKKIQHTGGYKFNYLDINMGDITNGKNHRTLKANNRTSHEGISKRGTS